MRPLNQFSWFALLLLVSAVSAFQTHHPTIHVAPTTDHVSRTALCSSLTSTIDVSENAQRDLSPLIQWAVNCGLQTSDGFDIRHTQNQDGLDDACVITTQDLPRDSPILYVPNEVMMTGEKARQELGSEASSAEQMLSRFYDQEEISKFYLFLKLLWRSIAILYLPEFSASILLQRCQHDGFLLRMPAAVCGWTCLGG